MIVALLISLSGTVFSGLVLYAVEEDAGPLAGWIANSKASKFPVIITSVYADDDEDDHEDEASEEFWEELHEFFANFTLLLVVLHVTGMLYSSYVDRENLVRAMITGRKRSGED